MDQDMPRSVMTPEGYHSAIVRVKPPHQPTNQSAAVLEDEVQVEYEGHTLVFKTILEEHELAPLFDGAYWPGTMVWPVSLWTGEYIHRHHRKRMSGTRFLELGCGCGAPGMMARILGASHVWLTEQPELIRIITHNIETNFGDKASGTLAGVGGVSTESLYWSRDNAQRFLDAYGRPDFVVCCDCIYEPFWGDSYRALLDCMELLCSRGEGEEDEGEEAVGIISVERRNADGVDKFLALARSRMDVRLVQEDQDLKWQIYELRQRRGKEAGGNSRRQLDPPGE